jgi:hypothetical protein
MLIFYHEVSLEDGFDILSKPKAERLVRGQAVSAASGAALFLSLRGHPIKCYNCGCEATSWIADRHKNHMGKPCLNLYARRCGVPVLMTRDHIIPKSLGGVDAVENLRPCCSDCNGLRGNEMTPQEQEFMAAHPHLVDPVRVVKGLAAMKRAEEHRVKTPDAQQL